MARDGTATIVSDATIDFEMGAVQRGHELRHPQTLRSGEPALSRASQSSKRCAAMNSRLEEYRKLHTVGRAWIGKANGTQATWYRTMCYNFMLIMCNTGMRPPEAKNLRWRDIMPAKDRDGREITVLFVQGKGKSRKLVAPKSVGDYLDRVRAISKATAPDDPVFTIINGKPAKYLYEDAVEKLLTAAELRMGPNGTPRSTYCFRHTYATFRLSEGVDVYMLAEQMGTSVKMIENHYGHVNTIKHADRVLQGMTGFEPMMTDPASTDGMARASAGAKARLATKPPAKPRRPRR